MKSVYVKLGAPWVTSVTTSPAANSIYIKDPVTYTVKGKDENDYIDSILVSWNDDTIFEARSKAVSDSTMFTNTFAKTDVGLRQVRFRVKDIDGLSKDSVISITVLSGAPRVDSVRISSVTGNNFFVKDNNTFRVFVSDVNGSPKKIYASWNNESAPMESLSVNITGSNGYGEFTHFYDTLLYGNRTVKFWVADDDSVMSASSKDTTILVRLAPPVIYAEGTTKDTVWVMIDSGVGRNYPIRIQHNDTNGTSMNYYWNEAGPSLGRMTTTDTIMRNFGGLEVNNGFNYWIYGRDDDGLTRGGRFVVFADSAPPKVETYPSPGADSITIYWSGKDKKDGNQTEYMILLREGANPDISRVEDILSGWKSGYSVSALGAYDYMFRFKLTPSGGTKTYRYRVLARDKRLSISQSDISNFPY